MYMKQGGGTWQEAAKNLRFGQKRKVPHCTKDASAYISNDPKGVRLYCFRCGAAEWEGHGRMSASDILAARRVDEEETRRPYPDVVSLYAPDTPAAARVWCLKAGLTPEIATDVYGFGWSDRTQRVIVPVLHNGEPTGGWTGRAVDGRKPKYLLPARSVGSSWYAFRERGEPCAVVEDVLSAIKIYRSGYSSIAVFGTTVGPTQALLLSSQADVVGWFDDDAAGHKGFAKLRKVLGPYGIEPRRVQSTCDPKLHNTDEIRKSIGDNPSE